MGKSILRLGKVYYTGSIGRHEVVLVESGIGKVMSAMSVAVLANDFKVEAIINTGSAGAVAREWLLGYRTCRQLAYHDVDVTAFGTSMVKWQVNHFTLNPVAILYQK